MTDCRFPTCSIHLSRFMSLCAMFFILSAYSLASPAWAASLYDQQNGLWASPNCESPKFYFYSDGDTYLYFWKNETPWIANLSSPESSRTTASHIIEKSNAGGDYFLSYVWFEGEQLVMAFGPNEKSPGNIEAVPDLPPSDANKETYQKCEKLLPTIYMVHAEGLKAVKFIAGMKRSCGEGSSGCGEYLFSFLDVSQDEKLSVAELSRAIRIATYASVAARPQGADDKTLTGSLMVANMIGPMVASSLIGGSDYDGDGQLSLEELFYDRDLASVEASLGKISLDALGASMGPILDGLTKLGKMF